MRTFVLPFLIIIILISCKSEIKKLDETLSSKNGMVVQELSNPTLINSSLPKLYSNGEQLYMSWVEKQDTVTVLKYSFFKNNNWSIPEEITSGTDWFVNWADYPAIAENNGNILTNLLQKSANGTYTYDVKLNLYSKEKESWKNNILLNLDGTHSEHGFVSILPYNEDSFFVTWLDGRTTVNVPKGEEQMTLRGAIITNDGDITQDTLLDDNTCECCNTAATITQNGPVVVYRNRSEDEIRDIGIVRWEDGQWTQPQIVIEDNWHIPGCPVNGPEIDALGSNLAMAWFTAANDNPKVQVAFSDDNGKTFGLPYRIDNGNAIGRVDVIMLNDNSAAVLWMEPSGVDTVIQLVKVTASGVINDPITISKTRSERSSGFPQLELVGDQLYIAWTSLENENPSVKVVSVLNKDL